MRIQRLIHPGFFCLLFSLACGPDLPGDPGTTADTGGAPGSSTGPDVLTTGTTMAVPVPTTGEPNPSTTTSDTPDMGDTSDTGDTTGEPSDCPKGQVPFAPAWSTVLTPPFTFAEVKPEGGMHVMADGRVAIAVRIRDGEPLQTAGGVLFLSPTGELLGVHPGGFGKGGPIHGLERAANDELVLAGTRLGVEPNPTWIARFGGDGSLIADTPVSAPNNFTAALGLLDTPVLLGFDGLSMELRAVKFTADGAGAEWALTMTGSELPLPAAVATGEDGTALLVTQGGASQAGHTWLGLRLVDSAGETRWTREIDGLAFRMAPDATAIPDAWVVLRTDHGPGGVVRLMAVAADDGETLWDIELAAQDEQGPPLATRVHRTGDHLTVPVIRSLAGDPVDLTDTRTVAAHRVSLEGAPIDVTPLQGAAVIEGLWEIDSAVGTCDQLIILAPGDDRTWVGGFTP